MSALSHALTWREAVALPCAPLSVRFPNVCQRRVESCNELSDGIFETELLELVQASHRSFSSPEQPKTDLLEATSIEREHCSAAVCERAIGEVATVKVHAVNGDGFTDEVPTGDALRHSCVPSGVEAGTVVKAAGESILRAGTAA